MKVSKIIEALAVAGALTLGSGSASALVVQDSWQLDLSALGWGTTTGIGHLNLSGGTGTVTQQLGANGLPDVGETFTEFGSIFSISSTANNTVGQGDFGASSAFTSFASGLAVSGFARPDLEVVFTGLTGTLSSVSGTGAVSYAFDAGVGSISIRARLVDSIFNTALTGYTDLVSFMLVSPSGGSLGNFLGGGVPNGQTDALGVMVVDPYGIFKDSAGNTLISSLVNPLIGVLHTDNKLVSPAPSVVTCDNNGVNCYTVLTVASDGSFDIARIPEPGTLALLGISLLGFVGARRKSASLK